MNVMRNLALIFPIVAEISRKAGGIARKHYYGEQLEIHKKTDDTPVTQADREVEIFLRDSLEQHFPEYSVIGEEFGEIKKSSSFRWIIDPIDGTKSFILRTPLFGILLALERDGVPILGSIYLPIQDQLMIGSPETGTFLNGSRCSVSKVSRLEDASLLISDPRDLMDKQKGRSMRELCRKVKVVRGFGDCYGYFLVACGVAEIMYDPSGVDYLDLAPMLPILEGAGGKFSAANGRIDFMAENGLGTNGLLHEKVVSILTNPNCVEMKLKN